MHAVAPLRCATVWLGPCLVAVMAVSSGCGGASKITSEPQVTAAKVTQAPAKSVASKRFLTDFAQTYRFRLGQPRSLRFTPDGESVLFLRSGTRDFVQDLYRMNVKDGKVVQLLTAQGILKGAAETLSIAEKARRERMRQTARGLASYALSKDGKQLLVPLSGRLYLVERATGKVAELPTKTGAHALDPQLSPDGRRVSYVVDGDLHVLDISQGKERRLTKREGPHIDYGAAEFVAQEEMRRRHGNWWSPDSKSLLVQRTDNFGVEQLHTYDPAHPERASHGSYYPRPGKKNADVTLQLLTIGRSKAVSVLWDRAKYPYLVKVVWSAKGPLTIVVQNRRQREQLVLAVDPKTGKSRTLLREVDTAWLNIDPQMPRWLKSGQFLWTTERNGAWQLELRAGDGKLVRALTAKELGYRKLVGVNETTGEVRVVASAEPTHAHIWTLTLDGNNKPEQLTKEAGQHAMTWHEDSGAGIWMKDTVAGGKSWTLTDGAGKQRFKLDAKSAKPGFDSVAEFHKVGKKNYRAMLFKPRNFDPKRRYPVIVYVYGGPHWAVVKRSSARLQLPQWIADHGYLVASFDGRGTPHRGRAWERAISGNFIAAPMNDQVAALQALGKKVPQMDMGRVGIYGWSFGGYFSAMAVMRRPDVFHCAVAGAPVADWRDYDTHYTERYIGLPESNKKGYDDGSVLKWAGKLRRPLLIIHGTADDNVYFTHAIKMSDALFRAGKHHELLPLTGFTHMVADPAVLASLYGRILGHFQRCIGSAAVATSASSNSENR